MTDSKLWPGYWVNHGGVGIFCYVDTLHPKQPLIALGSPRLEALESRFARQLDGAFEMLPVKFGAGVFYFALQGFDLRREKRSKRSAAEYLAKLDLGNRGFLIQRIPPNAETSAHAHAKKTERYTNVLGAPDLRLKAPVFGGGERRIKLRERHFVRRGVFHQLLTERHSALTLIEVVGPDALGMGDYIYEE